MNTADSRRVDTHKMVALAVLSAIAYVVMLVGRVPVVLFLKYDPKDIVIAIGGFIYGPMSALGMATVVAFVEMITVSTTGPIGFVMNVLSTASFACTASYIYANNKSIRAAAAGLAAGALAMTAIMLLWNYFVTPYYMRVSREDVAAMLVSAFLPFNLLKGGLNSAFTMLIYKPLVTTLRRAHLIPESVSEPTGGKINMGALLVATFVAASCIFAILVFRGVI